MTAAGGQPRPTSSPFERMTIAAFRLSGQPAVTVAPAARSVQQATIVAPDGTTLMACRAELRERTHGWSATLRCLDRPGVLATMYFADGVRDVDVRFADGRNARARITGTTFVETERLCFLTGTTPLA